MQINSIGGVAFWFWCIYALKISFVGLFFRDIPAKGTFFNFLISVAFFLFVSLKGLHQKREMFFSSATHWIYVYLVWAGISLIWTKADSTFSAAFYWAGVVLDVGIVWFMLRSDDRDRITVGSLKGIVVGGIVLSVLLLFFFETGGDGRVGNEIIHVNSLGYQIGLSCVASLFFVTQSLRKTKSFFFWYCVLIFLLSCLIYSLSKTSILSVGIVLVMYMILSERSRGKAFLLLLTSTVLLAFFWAVVKNYIDFYLLVNSSTLNDVTQTLSGRTILWVEVRRLIDQAPIIGYGFFSFRHAGPYIFSIKLPHAHNELLQQWFSLGIIGVLLMVAIYLAAARYWWRVFRRSTSSDSRYALAALMFLVYSFARGFTEASAVSLIFPLPLMLLLLSRRKNCPILVAPN